MHLSGLSLDEFKSLFTDQAVKTSEKAKESALIMGTQVPRVQAAPSEELTEKSTEELIKVLQEKKKKLLMLQYASKELEEQ